MLKSARNILTGSFFHPMKPEDSTFNAGGSGGGEVKVKPKSKKTTRTKRAQLQFSVGRVERRMRNHIKGGRVRIAHRAPVAVSAAVQHVLLDILYHASEECGREKRKRITVNHVNHAIQNNPHLKKLFAHVNFANVTVDMKRNLSDLPEVMPLPKAERLEACHKKKRRQRHRRHQKVVEHYHRRHSTPPPLQLPPPSNLNSTTTTPSPVMMTAKMSFEEESINTNDTDDDDCTTTTTDTGVPTTDGFIDFEHDAELSDNDDDGDDDDEFI